MTGLAFWLLVLGLVRPPTAEVAAELARLEGHRVTVAADGRSYVIADIAGEGTPRVGVIERRGDALYLVDDDARVYRLTGPLARPRIVAPGYRVWVLGEPGDGDTLELRRVGILRPPPAHR